MTLIGIGGRLASGKDTVADWLVENRGFVKMGMSDVLLEAALALDPWVAHGAIQWREDEFSAESPVLRLSEVIAQTGYTKAKENPEVRRFLQVLGTEVGRNMIGENVWVDMMERRLEHSPFAAIVVTGIRFRNEVEMIERLGGYTWWVSRPELQRGDAGGHASENGVELRDFQEHIRNDGTLAELYEKIRRITT